ncbi:MAG: 3-hydroxyacyl-CoA dehydrogenase, partial [Gammaproteobacteria bacterium]
MEMKGQAAIVTGGGSGMGAATARTLAAAGVRVAVLDLNPEAAEAVATEIDGTAFACNVADEKTVEAAITGAREAHGPARICINCAGVATAGRIVGRDGPLPLERFKQVVDVNLIGTFNVMRLAAADMIDFAPLADDERGVIINTASVA